jgi:hypothetical protein
MGCMAYSYTFFSRWKENLDEKKGFLYIAEKPCKNCNKKQQQQNNKNKQIG